MFELYIDNNQLATHDVLARLRVRPTLAWLWRDARQWVCRTLHKYGWSFKNATHKQRLKYTAENIECVRARRQRAARTDGGGGARSGLPCGMCTWSSRLPFTGSSTSTKRRLRVAVHRRRRRRRPTRAPTAGARPLAAELRRQRGVAPCGAPAVATNGDSLCEHYSVTIMVGLPPVGQPDAPTVFVNYRADGTNTASDLLAFVVAAVNGGFLKSGDVLLADNASIHKVPAMMLQLKAVPRCVQH